MINIYAHSYMIATRLDTLSVVDAPRPGEKRTGLKRFLPHQRKRKRDVPAHWLD